MQSSRKAIWEGLLNWVWVARIPVSSKPMNPPVRFKLKYGSLLMRAPVIHIIIGVCILRWLICTLLRLNVENSIALSKPFNGSRW